MGQLWDISDVRTADAAPRWQVDEPQVQFCHSALFSEDRHTVIFGDEIIVGTCNDGTGSGQLWFPSRRTGRTLSLPDSPGIRGRATVRLTCQQHSRDPARRTGGSLE